MNAPDVYQRYFKYISIEEANKTRTSPTNTLFKKVHDSNIWSIEAVDHWYNFLGSNNSMLGNYANLLTH
jgi:hypothetical protein